MTDGRDTSLWSSFFRSEELGITGQEEFREAGGEELAMAWGNGMTFMTWAKAILCCFHMMQLSQ